MSKFTGPLTVTHLELDGKWWRLETPLTYEIGHKGSGKAVSVPAGFVTDFASTPRPLWIFAPPTGSYARAAVIHDHLIHSLKTGDPHEHAPSRRAADAVFLEAMYVTGVPLVTRWLLYLGARAWALFIQAD